MVHHYSKEQKEFIKKYVKGRGNKELTEMFNKHFGLSLGINQIKSFKNNHKLSSGLDGRFEPGHVPANKGTKGVYNVGGNQTSYKKGNKPLNYKPVGAERIDVDGYVLIKVSDYGPCQDRWKLKHRVLWEEVNGPVPEGYVLVFADGNKQNLDLDNLILVSRKQLVRLNQNHLIKNDPELTKTGIIIADIINKASERKKKQ